MQRGRTDDAGGQYTVKEYDSEWIRDSEGNQVEHEAIVLNPLNPEFQAVPLEREGQF